MTDIMMSIKPKYVQKILSGQKTVELRRRKLNIQNGARVWIYTTLPKGCIEVVATIHSIEYTSPNKIWMMYSHKLGISKDEFDSYVHNCELVSAIRLVDIVELSSPVTLGFIRSCVHKFQPPQFYSHLKSDMEVSNLLFREVFSERIAS